jgi:hypothetical protein
MKLMRKILTSHDYLLKSPIVLGDLYLTHKIL